MSKMSLRKIISVCISPPVLSDDDEIIKILKYHNKDLKVQDWKIIFSTSRRNGKGTDIVDTVEEESSINLRNKEKYQFRIG